MRDSREVISECSRAIISVHGGNTSEAYSHAKRARSLLNKLRKSAEGQVARYLIPPEAEFVEASAVISISKSRPIPTRSALNVSPEAYLLGLLDTVGELKRMVLDSLMHDDIAKAQRAFSMMEQLYMACSPLAVYDHVVSGARRKIDVARMLVEDTRGFMTEELRREALVSSMGRLQKKLG